MDFLLQVAIPLILGLVLGSWFVLRGVPMLIRQIDKSLEDDSHDRR